MRSVSQPALLPRKGFRIRKFSAQGVASESTFSPHKRFSGKLASERHDGSRMSDSLTYGSNFYASAFNLGIPSQFAVFCAGEEQGKSKQIIEFGCGNGRDSAFFANSGFVVAASDAVEAPSIRSNSNPNLSFQAVNYPVGEDLVRYLASLTDVDQAIAYLRFLIHAVNVGTEDLIISQLVSLRQRGLQRVYLEFRTIKDQDLSKVTPSHYRRFIDPKEFTDKLSNTGFSIIYQVEGRGFAKLENDDAHVLRLIVH